MNSFKQSRWLGLDSVAIKSAWVQELSEHSASIRKIYFMVVICDTS